MPKHHLVLLGGGFAGTWIATHAIPNHQDILEVTLISKDPVFTFSPLLINGLSGDLPEKAFTLDLTKLAPERGFRFIQGTVDLIDRDARTVHVQQADGTRSELSYDSAVLTTGAKANFFGIPGLEEYAFTLKARSDVDRLAAHLNELLTRASTAWTEEDKKRLLSFVVVGGGPTGVELLGAMRHRLHALAYERGLEALIPCINITLIESNCLLFHGFPEALSTKSETTLREGGITIRRNARVTHVDEKAVSFAEDSPLPYQTLIWAAGIQPNPPSIQPAFPPGPLQTDAFLRLDEHLYGAGDVVKHEQAGKVSPKNAQFALQMADAILANILRTIRGKPLLPTNMHYAAALVTVLETGFFRFGSIVLQGRWVHPFRKLLYRLRLWQIRHGR